MSAAGAKMTREMVTPEGVDLALRLADGGERAAAFALDLLFMVLILIAMSLGLALLGYLTGIAMVEYVAAVWLLGFFLLRNFYFTAFELTLRASTPGKRITGLRVAMRDGSPLTANAVFARNAMRELEVFLPMMFLFTQGSGVDAWISLIGTVWCGVFVFFPLFNRDRLRIGDLVGGTWVVVAPKRILDDDLSAQAAPAVLFSEAALDAYGIKELGILENVLRRKDQAIMAAVAMRIRAKTGFDTPMPDEQFLAAYYKGLRGRLEGRLLFGVRRRDKHQKV
ncbi:MAG: RDD family protein [Alphaproteobacteria bacterium]|nr:RDD family protein [Alphaproteobacteria bacterium]